MRITLDLSELDDEVARQLLEIGNRLVEHLRDEAPVGATGDLQRSMQIFRATDGRVVLGSRIHYAADVQYGTEPHLADFEGLQKWARRKLGSEAAAGPVWRKIAEEGTEANPFVDRAIEATLDDF